MRHLRNNRGVTLVELLIALLIGAMIAGLVFLVPQVFHQQNMYNNEFNSAKNEILLITNTLNERFAKADSVNVDKTCSTFTLNGTNEKEQFIFEQQFSPENYLYQVKYKAGSEERILGKAGFHLENCDSTQPLTFLILTLWAPYNQTNSSEGRFIVTQGFHTSVMNQR
ncbi:type II secretion system protein [Neobacillus mesonae]|uniref:type II secretion system protein n=1 Tax=Neobacillus mesonae TaxID=1193713 RepID=UPI00203A4808|nr:prepilin-type N-terminal cleavage/methylation domain-containing protein [Neobacillus mesonae]MCM3568395.1 prepilin-type N-terminal cleavage/methylation domain-containing protein [Neobacillus mesonae]